MTRTLSLRPALKRGAIVVAANWPVVLIDLTLEAFYKLALLVPIMGGALMVAAIVGTNLGDVVAEGAITAGDQIVASLDSAPIALGAFFVAVALLGFVGQGVIFVVKAGTLAVLVEGERAADDIADLPFSRTSLQHASRYELGRVYQATRHFARRAIVLASWLGTTYAVVGLGYLAIARWGLSIANAISWLPAWPLLMLASTGVTLILIAIANLLYDLLRVIVVTDDCTVREAVGRLRHFVIEDARQVVGILSVMAGVLVVAAGASILAAGGLTMMAWVPVVSLVVVPLQLGAWAVRGVLFQYLSLSALSAYQTQYRRFAGHRDGGQPRPFAVTARDRP